VRIRFFNTYEPVSPTYRDLLPFLAQQGISVEVMVSSYEYRPGRKPLEESLSHPLIEVIRMPGPSGVVKSRLQKLWATTIFAVVAPLRALFGRSVDLNFFFTQPPLFSLWGIIFRLFRGQPYLYQVMDVYPDVAVQNGMLDKDAFSTRFLSKLSRLSIMQADEVIAIGRCMASFLKEQGIPENRIHIIPNWVSDHDVHPVPREINVLRKELGIDGEFVVLYSGNLGVSHYFDDIVEAARQLRHNEGIQFVFVGDGVRRKEIMTAVKEDALDNILLLPFQSFDRLAESLSMGDVHFISLRSGFEGLVVPSKAYSALGTGRPLIYQGEARGEIARMIEDEQIGTVVPLGDPVKLKQAILTYYENPDILLAQGDRALVLNRGKYSREQALNAYMQAINEVAQA
jgi:colanic acid biosynthesis glycosyl transferase WcaI